MRKRHAASLVRDLIGALQRSEEPAPTTRMLTTNSKGATPNAGSVIQPDVQRGSYYQVGPLYEKICPMSCLGCIFSLLARKLGAHALRAEKSAGSRSGV